MQAELDALAQEYEPLMESVQERVAVLDGEIKAAVLQQGASVKGSRLYAMYTRGRISWDTERLDRYALDHPEVTKFRRQGEPSVSLRVVKK